MPANSDSVLKNKGGAPLGNTNALKHGFYARSLRRAESKKLEADLLGECKNEITLLRSLILRTSEALKSQSHLSLMEYLAALRGVAQGVSCLASIYRAQKVVLGRGHSQESLEEYARGLPMFREGIFMKFIEANPDTPLEVLQQLFPSELLTNEPSTEVVPPVVPQK